MLKRFLFISFIILAGCSNPPAPKEYDVKTVTPKKQAAPARKSAVNPWTISSFASKPGATEERKFVRFVTEGKFADSTNSNRNLYAEVLVNKRNAGIFLHELTKNSPAEQFSDNVQIKMTNQDGQELIMNSSRRWNSSGGIMIESNNNDYSRFRIFLLQSKATVIVEIKDSGTKVYNFSINADGFSDSFSKL